MSVTTAPRAQVTSIDWTPTGNPPPYPSSTEAQPALPPYPSSIEAPPENPPDYRSASTATAASANLQVSVFIDQPPPPYPSPKPSFLSNLFAICTGLSAICTGLSAICTALSAICTALSALSWKKRFYILLVIGLIIVLPAMMIVYGLQNNPVVCVIPCENSTMQNNTVVCVFPCKNCSNIRNKYYVLPTPSIGISVPQAFIGSGVIYMVLGIAVSVMYVFKSKVLNRFYGIIIIILLIWTSMCIRIFDLMRQTCFDYFYYVYIDSLELEWLLGVSISVLAMTIIVFLLNTDDTATV